MRRPRPYVDSLARLARQAPFTFPSFALDLARQISRSSFEGELGRALEVEGYAPDPAHYGWLRERGHSSHRQMLARCYRAEFLGLLRRGVRTDDRESILRFLEMNPYFCGSGYLKQGMIQFLRRIELGAEDRVRIERILREAVLGGWKVSMPDWLRLTSLCSPNAVQAIVREALRSEQEDVVRRGLKLRDRLYSQSSSHERAKVEGGVRES